MGNFEIQNARVAGDPPQRGVRNVSRCNVSLQIQTLALILPMQSNACWRRSQPRPFAELNRKDRYICCGSLRVYFPCLSQCHHCYISNYHPCPITSSPPSASRVEAFPMVWQGEVGWPEWRTRTGATTPRRRKRRMRTPFKPRVLVLHQRLTLAVPQ